MMAGARSYWKKRDLLTPPILAARRQSQPCPGHRGVDKLAVI